MATGGDKLLARYQLNMSSHVWCHAPKCHKSHTLDRVRGSKGSKVLRTRKVAQTKWNTGDRRSMFSYFCSLGCYNQFANTHIERIVAIAPRLTPLETPIEDPIKETNETNYGHRYTSTHIKLKGVDTAE